MSYPRRVRLRQSGVSAFGEIPDHWQVRRLKFAASINAGQSPPSELVKTAEDGLPFLQGNAEFGALSPTPRQVCDSAPRRAAPNDILLSVRAPVGAVNIADQQYGIGRGLCCVTPSGELDPLYCFFLLSTTKCQLDAVATGSTYDAVSVDDVGNLPMLQPPLGEQRAIASFLAGETARCDALIGRQQRLIELLNEKRQAIVSHAVTKGLCPHAPVKSSGNAWIGDVPAHWEVRSLSSVTAKITNGYVGPTRDILVGEGVRYLQSLHIKHNRIRFHVPYFVSEEWSAQHPRSVLEAGDVLIVQTGDIGQVALVTDEFAGCNCHALIVVAPDRAIVEGEWLSWCLNADYGFHSLLSLQTGALHPHLNCGNVKRIEIPLPPLEEQRQIAVHISTELGVLDQLRAEAERAVALLREHRTVLVFDAVTGKIDVSNSVEVEVG